MTSSIRAGHEPVARLANRLRRERRLHDALRQHVPCGVEVLRQARESELRPVRARVDLYDAAGPRHAASSLVAGIVRGPIARRVQQQRFDSGGRFRQLARSAQQIEARGHDIGGAADTLNDV
ncbi:MAG: hypothetical protein DMD59_06135 [Gemmatimonadetes bacterium]|nr:MAG: hypothetical protein DMD59_06135 [Gemmatimonadota bacterium]